jgi:hypothetical protein
MAGFMLLSTRRRNEASERVRVVVATRGASTMREAAARLVADRRGLRRRGLAHDDWQRFGRFTAGSAGRRARASPFRRGVSGTRRAGATTSAPGGRRHGDGSRLGSGSGVADRDAMSAARRMPRARRDGRPRAAAAAALDHLALAAQALELPRIALGLFASAGLRAPTSRDSRCLARAPGCGRRSRRLGVAC